MVKNVEGKTRNKNKGKASIGIDASPPKDSCTSSTCPWHGSLRTRGRVFHGRVVSSKPMNTAIVEWDFYQLVPKYQRRMRKKTRIAAHNPSCIAAKQDDKVTIAECRPISKTKRFVVVEKF